MVVKRQSEEVLFVPGRDREWDGGGIDETAQHLRKDGLAAALRAADDQDRVGRGGPEGSKDPDDGAFERGALEVEKGTKMVPQRFAVDDGAGKRKRGTSGQKMQ